MEKIEDRWYQSFLVWVVVGIIFVSVIVNIVMVVIAANSFGGLVVDDYYKRGQSFTNRTKLDHISRISKEYQLDMILPEKVIKGAKSRYVATILKDGNPVKIDDAVIYFYRPSDSKYDFHVLMNSSEKAGEYFADVDIDMKGIWDLIIEFKVGNDLVNKGARITIFEN